MTKTANQILNEYETSLKMDATTDLQKVILDILKYLVESEGGDRQTIAMHQRMFYRDLWKKIEKQSTLEKFRRLENEKNGM